MIKNLEAQKAKLKEKISNEIDNYFMDLERSAGKEGFDINTLEKLMVENQQRLKDVINETNSGVASSVETKEKKTARHAVAQ